MRTANPEQDGLLVEGAREDLKFYAKIAQLGLGYVAGQLELTSKCEQFCPNCDSWKSHHNGSIEGTLEFSEVANIFMQLNDMKTFEHLSLTGGDPLSHPGIKGLLRLPRKFKLQLNTALPKPIDEELQELLRTRVDSLRVSLDGVRPATYAKMRGVPTDPETILSRLEQIAHPFWATNTCVADANVHEMLDILMRLEKMKHKPRKAMFLAVLARDVSPEFWTKYRLMANNIRTIDWEIETSVAEDVQAVRTFLKGPEAEEIPCYSGNLSFHIKATGEVYPCCLVGGEAIPTIKPMAIGNVKEDFLNVIQERYASDVPKHYAGKTPCRSVCQWKQLTINRLAHAASKTGLRMP